MAVSHIIYIFYSENTGFSAVVDPVNKSTSVFPVQNTVFFMYSVDMLRKNCSPTKNASNSGLMF